MTMLRYLLRHSPGLIVLAAVAGVVSGASSTGLLALINGALGAGPAGRTAILIGFVALCALVPVSRVVSEFLLIRLGQETVLRLRLDMSRSVLAVPLRHLEAIGPHRVLSTLAEDVPSITGAVALLPLVCINGAVLTGCLIYLGWLSAPLLIGVVLVIVLGIVSYQFPVLRANRHFRRARLVNDELYHRFRGLTEGAKELKLHARRRQAFLGDDLQSTAERFRDETIAGGRIYTVAASWGQLLVFVVIGLVLLVPGAAQGDERVLTGYALTLLYLMTPLQMLMNSVPAFHRARVALDRVEKLGLELAAEAAEPVLGPAPAPPPWKRLELRGVLHTYEGGFTVGPLDLEIRAGELLFLAGGNGSGKTTLAKLLTGLYAPDAGEVVLDGQPVRSEDERERYRQLFSVVFFDFHLFEWLLGLEGEDLDRRAAEYLRQLRLEHKVRVEGGRLTSTDLSQGQRKRLALLTACLEDRPIYLFDEWAADQDPSFKEYFYRQLLPELKARGKTCIVISHDDRYYDAGDRLVKIEDGRIVADLRDPAPAAPYVVTAAPAVAVPDPEPSCT